MSGDAEDLDGDGDDLLGPGASPGPVRSRFEDSIYAAIKQSRRLIKESHRVLADSRGKVSSPF